MTQKKLGITSRRHAELGEELRQVQKTLSTVLKEVQEAYPLTGNPGRVFRKAEVATDAVYNLRSALEDRALEECPFGPAPDGVTYGVYLD
jgi:DNA anti-recombination protein RmuC